MMIKNIYSDHLRSWKEFGQPRRHFASAAAGVEYARLGRERVTMKQSYFLRPDCTRLCVQVSDHRFVGHLLGLGVEIGHGILQPADHRHSLDRTSNLL